jgi:hypothetical protein
LGWNQKTASAILIAFGAILTAFLRYGWRGMTESMAGYFWIGSAPVIAGFALFAWNFITVQAELYASLAQTSTDKITKLEDKVTSYEAKMAPPNYDALRATDTFSINDAAFYWCDLQPGARSTPDVIDWRKALIDGVRKGEVKFISRYQLQDARAADSQIDSWRIPLRRSL